MKIVEKIMIVVIALGVAWMSIKCAHDVGYRKAMLANEDKVEWAIQDTSDELLEACERAIDAAAEKCDERIEQARIEGENAVLEMF